MQYQRLRTCTRNRRYIFTIIDLISHLSIARTLPRKLSLTVGNCNGHFLYSLHEYLDISLTYLSLVSILLFFFVEKNELYKLYAGNCEIWQRLE